MSQDHYSEKELQEFKSIILVKLKKARLELADLLLDIKGNDNTTDDTDGKALRFFEDGYENVSKEEQSEIASRQIKLIEHLENALIRIETKTYGYCRDTGKLISKERLLVVPHATLSLEAKLKRDKDL